MDNVTLFKKIFSDRDRFAKPFRNYLDQNATHPKLSCTEEDLKRFSFKKESLKQTLSLLCLCEPIRPEIAKSAYECLKRNENQDMVLLECEIEVTALNRTVHEVLDKLNEDNKRFDQVKSACSETLEEFFTQATDDSAARFHACFVPLICSSQLKRAINCVNKNHEELHGCEKDIDEMLICSIDMWTQHLMKITNYKPKSDDE